MSARKCVCACTVCVCAHTYTYTCTPCPSMKHEMHLLFNNLHSWAWDVYMYLYVSTCVYIRT